MSDRVDHYDDVYDRFALDVQERVRRETFDEDIGQHSWLTVAEYRAWLPRLGIAPGADVLDVASGAGGPSLFLARTTGARVAATDLARAEGLAGRARFVRADASRPLPFAAGRYDAVVCIDAVNHLADRAGVLAEWRRVLRPGGRLLFTDPMVVTGLLATDEIAARSLNGPSHVVPPGEDERLLAAAGFRLLHREDATVGVALVAGRRLAARGRHRAALLEVEGEAGFERGQRYYAAVRTLAAERRLSRFMFLASCSAAGWGGESRRPAVPVASTTHYVSLPALNAVAPGHIPFQPDLAISSCSTAPGGSPAPGRLPAGGGGLAGPVVGRYRSRRFSRSNAIKGARSIRRRVDGCSAPRRRFRRVLAKARTCSPSATESTASPPSRARSRT